SAFPGWEGATGYVMISPAMGAELSQILIRYDAAGGVARFPADGHEHALYVEAGTAHASWTGGNRALAAGDFLFVPAGCGLELSGGGATRITVFRKRFETVPSIGAPPVVWGSAGEVEGETFLGNENARLQVLL